MLFCRLIPTIEERLITVYMRKHYNTITDATHGDPLLPSRLLYIYRHTNVTRCNLDRNCIHKLLVCVMNEFMKITVQTQSTWIGIKRFEICNYNFQLNCNVCINKYKKKQN